MSIFDKRVNYKPFEYPGIYQFTEAINKSFWVHSEVDFTADIQDFHVKLENKEQSAIKNSLLAIAQIEVAVKTFWGNLYQHFPKPEFNGLGSTFAECYIEGTEVLTIKGWKEIKDVSSDDLVASFNDDRTIFFREYKSKIDKPYDGKLVTLNSKDHCSIVTPNHNMRIYKNGSNKLENVLAKDLNVKNSSYRFPVSTGTTNDYYDTLHTLDFKHRLFLAIQADGCLRRFRNKEGVKINRGVPKDSKCYELSFKKTNKAERLQWILDNLDYDYNYRMYNGKHQFEVYIPNSVNYDLKSLSWIFEDSVTSQLVTPHCKAIIAELSFWDGFKLENKKNCRIKYSTTSKENADIIQLLGTVAGYKTNLTTVIDNRSDSFSDVFVVSFNINRKTLPVTSLTKNTIDYSGRVYCLDMGNGNLITRYNNKVFFGGNCEFRHSEAYSRLLDVLGYNDEFEDLLDVPVMKERIDYLSKVLTGAKEDGDDLTARKKYVISLILFSLLIENVSLFSQFAIILSFTRFKGYIKNVSNIIAWTSVDEQVHANAGIYIIDLIRKEFPDFFDEETEKEVLKIAKESIEVESRILDWIFENGEIDTISKENLLNFMKYRVDDSLVKIGFSKIFNITSEQYKPMVWFEEEIYANSLDDFFAKRPVDYAKHDKPITSNDLF